MNNPRALPKMTVVAFCCLILLGLASLLSRPAAAQSDVRISGRGFFDYEAILAHPDEAREGDNGFIYRRMYLTTDYRMAPQLVGRIRFEATQSSAPQIFIKDFFVTWQDVLGAGHNLTVGLSVPPLIIPIPMQVWGYRSLERTLAHRNVLSSRDLGLFLEGPLSRSGALRYGLMLGNNGGLTPEVDRDKRVVGGLAWQPDEPLVLTASATYAAGEGDQDFALAGFAGYRTDRLRLGAEGFWQRLDTADDFLDPLHRTGVSVFAVFKPRPPLSLIGRLDLVGHDENDEADLFAVLGLGYRFNEHIELIPNLILDEPVGTGRTLLGRITLVAEF